MTSSRSSRNSFRPTRHLKCVVLSTEGSVSARNGKGGTSPLRVREQIVSAKTAIEQLRAFANSVSDGPAYKTPESLLK